MKLLRRQRNILSLLCLVYFLIFASDASALAGADTPLKKIEDPKRGACYIYSQYIVLFPNVDPLEIKSAWDSLVLVKKRHGDNDFDCTRPLKGQELLTIDAGTFEGLYNHFVFTDIRTGPDVGTIEIYNLEKKRKVQFVVYSSEGVRNHLEDNGLIYSKNRHDLRSKRQCPDAKKWGSDSDYGFEQETRLDLDSLREHSIGKITCSPRQ